MTRGLSGEHLDGMRAKAILNRSTAIEDVAEQAVSFCRADSVTGQVQIVDGGIRFH